MSNIRQEIYEVVHQAFKHAEVSFGEEDAATDNLLALFEKMCNEARVDEVEGFLEQRRNVILEKGSSAEPGVYHTPRATVVSDTVMLQRLAHLTALKTKLGADCRCDGGDIPHNHLTTDGESHNIRPDLPTTKEEKESA
jgi:hypothetical protein